MELLWIFLLIFNVYAASGNKPEGRPEDCHRECVVFNIPHILCAPDVSKVSVTPYYECTTVPQFRNLLSKECLTPLCDFASERCRTECYDPKPCQPPKSQISYQPTDSYPDPDDSLVGYVDPAFMDETGQSNIQDENNAPLVENNFSKIDSMGGETEDIPTTGTLNNYFNGQPPKKPPTSLGPPQWPPHPKPSPPCVEPPKWPPPRPEPPKPPPSCVEPPKWPPPRPEPPKPPPSCVEPPKWPPPPCPEPPKWPPECPEPPKPPPYCEEPPKWPPPSCSYPPNWPPACCEPPKWPPPCPEPPKWPPVCCEPSNWPPPCPEPPKPPCKSGAPKECLTPVLQNAPTSTVVYPDISCGCYVNPRYFCELYKLYNQDDDENVDSYDPIASSTGQGKYGLKLGPVDTSYSGTDSVRNNNRGTTPAGRTFLLYNTNPKDRVWTSSSRDGEFVPALCFDREYINKCCMSCPPPPPPTPPPPPPPTPPSPPPPKPQPQYPPYITQDEQLGIPQQNSPVQVPSQEMEAKPPQSELDKDFDFVFFNGDNQPEYRPEYNPESDSHISQTEYGQTIQEEDEDEDETATGEQLPEGLFQQNK